VDKLPISLKDNTNIELLNSLKFLIALDFDPFNLLDSLQLKESEKFRTSDNYIQQALELAGYKNLVPIENKNSYVYIKDISDENLKIFIGRHLENEKENPMDEMLRLSGGTIVTNSKRIIFSPTCCTDITDYDNWVNLKKTTNFESIWVGHPWVLYKTMNELIFFTDYIEANGDDIDETYIRYKANYNKVLKEAEKLILEMNLLEKRVHKSLTELSIDDPTKITNCILRGICEPKF